MRLPVILLACSAAGILGGGALIGVWALGVCLIFVSLCAGAWALFHDDGTEGRPQVRGAVTGDVLEWARRAS
jgi:hypothetical protein